MSRQQFDKMDPKGKKEFEVNLTSEMNQPQEDGIRIHVEKDLPIETEDAYIDFQQDVMQEFQSLAGYAAIFSPEVWKTFIEIFQDSDVREVFSRILPTKEGVRFAIKEGTESLLTATAAVNLPLALKWIPDNQKCFQDENGTVVWNGILKDSPKLIFATVILLNILANTGARRVFSEETFQKIESVKHLLVGLVASYLFIRQLELEHKIPHEAIIAGQVMVIVGKLTEYILENAGKEKLEEAYYILTENMGFHSGALKGTAGILQLLTVLLGSFGAMHALCGTMVNVWDNAYDNYTKTPEEREYEGQIIRYIALTHASLITFASLFRYVEKPLKIIFESEDNLALSWLALMSFIQCLGGLRPELKLADSFIWTPTSIGTLVYIGAGSVISAIDQLKQHLESKYKAEKGEEQQAAQDEAWSSSSALYEVGDWIVEKGRQLLYDAYNVLTWKDSHGIYNQSGKEMEDSAAFSPEPPVETKQENTSSAIGVGDWILHSIYGMFQSNPDPISPGLPVEPIDENTPIQTIDADYGSWNKNKP